MEHEGKLQSARALLKELKAAYESMPPTSRAVVRDVLRESNLACAAHRQTDATGAAL